jgi:homoserine O-acetyltransferase
VSDAPDVALVYLPYGPLERPSLALGILKAAAEAAGLSCRVLYATFGFADEIGVGVYNGLSWLRADMLGEWTFAGAAFPDFAPDHAAYLRRATARVPGDAAFLPETLWAVRERAPGFVARTAAEVARLRPRIVACSSTFNQHCAVLAFTRALKALVPDVVTVVGGANCEAGMGLATRTHFPWIDYVVSGEGDHVFPALCRHILSGSTGPLPFGVLGASAPPRNAPVPRAVVERLDDTPVPDFDDYFAALAAFAGRDRIDVGVPVETARGCWWGEIRHCTFCGLNGDGGMRFRAKSPARAVAELRELRRRHGVGRFHLVDNILDLSYFESVVPALAGDGLSFFVEIKANVGRAQLEALARAGVGWLQPGIESLHDGALALMEKGTRTWINLQLLKWARELGQHVSWNVLCGFPGEDDGWYAEMAAQVPLLEHLQPPSNGLRRIRFDRFSPHQMRPADFGLTLRPGWGYRHVYPLPEAALADLVYVFERADAEVQEAGFGGPGRDALAAALDAWAKRFRSGVPPILCMTEEADRTTVLDTRRVAPARKVVLRGLPHRVHRACASARTLDGLERALATDGGPTVTAAAVAATARALVRRRLVLATGGRFLALALAGEVPSLPLALEEGYPGGCVRRRRHGMQPGVGALVQPRVAAFPDPLPLACGRTLPGWSIAYETYGALGRARDNAILVCHPLTADAHAAGRHGPADRRPGWWDAAIGPGRVLDTDRFLVVATAVVGGSGGSTGPASVNPQTGRPWGTDFPVLGVSDMVRAQRPLLDRLGVRRLHAVIGGCFGGQQALSWAIEFPDLVERAVVLATTPATSAHTIALFALLRRLVRADPAWRDGDYYGHGLPRQGLGAALAAAVPLWMNREAMERRFGRRRAGDGQEWTLGPEFAVEQFLDDVAARGVERLDPNALLYLTRAEDYFDLAAEYGSLPAALTRIRARTLLVSFADDWRYPPAEVERLAAGIADARHVTAASPLGHDAIRYDVPSWAEPVRAFLADADRLLAARQ